MGASQHFTREPGFAHSGGSDDDDTGEIANSTKRAANNSQLAVAPGQRIAVDHGPYYNPPYGISGENSAAILWPYLRLLGPRFRFA